MIKSNKKALIIWDFDGVIADSEKLWVKVWCDLLKKEKNIILTEDEKLMLLVGVAGRTKKHNLQRYFPDIQFDDDFMQKISEGEYYAGNHFMHPIQDVEKVFSDKNFDHCIATGSTKEQLDWKISIFKWIANYVGPKDRFTVDMVEHGKPAPDVFLLAAKTMGYAPKNCIVIEDSIHGITAAKAAGMKCIAFLGAEGNNSPEYREKCLNAGADVTCTTMKEVHQAIQNLSILPPHKGIKN